MLKADEASGNILFEEVQRCPKWIERIAVFGLTMTIVGVLVSLITEKEKTDVVIACATIVPAAIIGIYFNSNVRLEKSVTSNGLYYKWKPWHKTFRVIEKDEIESFQVRKFRSLSYGSGWSPGYGRYYNASSGKGLQLYLKNGKKFYLSTADIDSFERAMNNLINPTSKQRFSEF